MAIVKKTLQNLKPGKQYLLTVRAKDADLNNTLDPSAAIRFTVPTKVDAPTELGNLEVAANYQSIMISFNPSNDIDLKWYKYRVYTQSQIQLNGLEYTPVNENVFLLEGYSTSNVFTIDVQQNSSATPNNDGSTTTNNVVYYAKVRSVDNSGNESAWTQIASSAATPLIQSAHIADLTAGKITSGTINAAEITLNGSNSIIQSSTYDADPTQGWHISGDGHFSLGGENGIIFDGTQVQIKSNVVIQPGVQTPDSSGLLFSGLTINAAVGGVGGLAIGSNSLNYWYTTGKFRTGTADKYLLFDPAGDGSLTVNGTTIQNGTVGGVSAATTKIHLGTGTYANANTPFYVGRETTDATSVNRFSLGNKLTWDGTTLSIDGTVTIGSQTATAISNAVTTANNAAAAAATAQTTADGKINGAAVNANVTSISGAVITTGAIQSNNFNWNGTDTFSTAGTGIYLSSGDIVAKKFRIFSDGSATFGGTLSGASGSVGEGFSIGGSLTVGNNVRVNGASADGNLTTFKIRGEGIVAGKWALRVQNNTPTNIFSVENDGLVSVNGDLSVNGTTTLAGTSTNALTVGGNLITTGYVNFDQGAGNTTGAIVLTTNTNVGVICFNDQTISTNKRVYWKVGTGSSIRFKENIQPIADTLDSINNFWNLQPVLFEYKPNHGGALKEERPYGFRKHYGFIAEEVEELVPYMVSYDDDSLTDDVKYNSVLTVLYSEVRKMRQWLMNNYNYPG